MKTDKEVLQHVYETMVAMQFDGRGKCNCCHTISECQKDCDAAEAIADLRELIDNKCKAFYEQPTTSAQPLTPEQLEQEFCNITGLETGVNPAAVDTKRALVWFKKGYHFASGITASPETEA